MAGSRKRAKRQENPHGKVVVQGGGPEQYYSENPAWAFATADQEMWAFSQEHLGVRIWTEILPRLKDLETQTWSEILLKGKKQNHNIDLADLSKGAQDRLAAKYIEADSVMSLRITGNHRLYGYMVGRVFSVLWYDDEHGDNDFCVCRSFLKHT